MTEGFDADQAFQQRLKRSDAMRAWPPERRSEHQLCVGISVRAGVLILLSEV